MFAASLDTCVPSTRRHGEVIAKREAIELVVVATPARNVPGRPALVASVTYDSRLHELRMPVLVIHGEEDPRTEPNELDRLRREVPHAEIHMIAGAGHAPHSERDHAATVTQIVAAWITARAGA